MRKIYHQLQSLLELYARYKTMETNLLRFLHKIN